MKSLTVIASLLLTVLVSTGANARSIRIPGYKADLEVLYLDPKLTTLPSDKASVEISHVSKTIKLAIYLNMPECPINAMCIQMMPAPIIVTLPITEDAQVDGCGAVHYVASLDQRPVDGLFQRIEVTDNSQNRCMTFAALSGVEVSYETAGYDRLEQLTFETRSLMAGKKLLPTFFVNPSNN